MYESRNFEEDFDFLPVDDGARHAVRLSLKRDPRAGGGEIAQLRPGLKLTTVDVVHPVMSRRRYASDDVIKVHVRLQGGAHIGGDHGNSTSLDGGSSLMIAQPRDSEKYETVMAGRERSITLACSRDFLSDVAIFASGTMPSIVRNFADGRSAFAIRLMAPTLQMRRVAEELLDGGTRHGFRRMMQEAKALELLCMALDQAIDRQAGVPALRVQDRSRVDELCVILQSEAGARLSVGDLCRAVAWNETQMMECFKQVTGLTISSYRTRLIMDRAFDRLSNSDATISEIAFDAGYDHPSNFATAFKRTFGVSPRAARLKH